MHAINKSLKTKPRVLVHLSWTNPPVFRAIIQYAKKAGWHLEARNYFQNTIPLDWQGDGILYSTGFDRAANDFIRAQAAKIPVVMCGNNIDIPVPFVTCDNHAVGRMAAAHLLGQGHRHFAWVSPAGDQPIARARREGFRAALQDAGFDCTILERKGTRSATPADWQRWQQKLAKQLSALPHPTAVFALDDQVAAEVVEVCMARGIRVPEDIAIIGVGNIELACECSQIPLTSVAIPEAEEAIRAATLLDAMMQGRKIPKTPIILPPIGVVPRQSTGTLVISHPGLRAATDFIDRQMAKPITMNDLTEAAGISRRMLYYVFKQELHCAPAEYLLKERMKRACRLMLETDRRIGAIAVSCGFPNLSSFGRTFQRLNRESPKIWRRNALSDD